MSELARLLGAYAAPHKIEHNSKVFEFKPVTHKVMTALEKRSYKRARDSVHEMKDELSKDEFIQLLSLKSKAYDKGEYAFGTESSMGYYTSPKGIHELVSELCGCTTDEALSLIEDRGDEVGILCVCVILGSFPNLLPLLIEKEQQGDQAILMLISQMKKQMK